MEKSGRWWVVSVGCNGEEWEMVDGEECGWWWRGGWDERNGRVWEEGVVGGTVDWVKTDTGRYG